MKTIKNNVENTLIIKNSRFITHLIKVIDENEIENILNEIKITYPKATHYCYAYIIDNKAKQSDDKEPSKTAGAPMMNILEKEKLTNILAITIRYFGGIKLGTGGLIRAYSSSIKEALKKVEIVNVEKAKLVEITINYDMQKNLDYLLKEEVIIKKSWKEKIIYEVLIKEKNLNILQEYSYKILKDSYIEKNK